MKDCGAFFLNHPGHQTYSVPMGQARHMVALSSQSFCSIQAGNRNPLPIYLSIDRSIDLSIYHPVLNAISIYNNVVDYFNALDSLFIYWDVQTWGLVDNHSGYHHVRMLNHVEPPFLKLDPSFCWYCKTKIVDS